MDRRSLLPALAAAVMALAGCSSSTAPPIEGAPPSEQLLVELSLAAAPQVVDDGMYDSAEPAAFSVHGGAGTLTFGGDDRSPNQEPSPHVGRRFWRVIHDVDRRVVVNFDPTESDARPSSAVVEIRKTLNGSFHTRESEVVTGASGGDSLVVRTDVKPLRDEWVRRVWVARRAADPATGREWRVVAASPVQVASNTDPRPLVRAVSLVAEGLDVLLDDPTGPIFWRDLPRVPWGRDVRVTATTLATDDVVVLMHAGGRVYLESNGDGTYSGIWRSGTNAGIRHFGVNALSRGSLATGGEYRSHAWLFPYLSEDEVVADDL